MLRTAAVVLACFALAVALSVTLGYVALVTLPCRWFGSGFEGACGYAAVFAVTGAVIVAIPVFTILFAWLYRRRASPRSPARSEGAEVSPPWVVWPGAEPWSFKQGENEAWLAQVFLPYWRRLDPAGRDAYLTRWPPPDDDWREYLTRHWA